MNTRSKSQKAHSTKQILSILFTFILALSLPSFSVVSATGDPSYWLDVQTLKASDLGVSAFSGLGYMPDDASFFAMDSGSSELVTFTMRGDLLSTNPSSLSVTNPLNLTYNPKTDGIYSLSETQGLLEEGTGLTTQQSPDYQVPLDTFENSQGITFNPQTGDLYILDASGPTLIQISASNNNQTSSLIQAETVNLEGLAFNPEDNYLYVYSVDENFVYAINENGSIVSSFDFTALNITDFSGITFAPSSDSTDDPANMNLFLADSGTTGMDSQVIELDITATAIPQDVIDAALPSNLVSTINAYLWTPPNTDTTGLEYLLTENRLLISDADVEEPPAPYFADVNLWESTNTGTVTDTCDTTSVSSGGLGYSNEPTGLAANQETGQRFIADDNATEVFVIDLGDDETFCTGDDIRYQFDTSALGSDDPEGIAYGDGKLFITDGVDAEIYIIGPGPDGVFEGGDEVLLDQFDTANLFGTTGLSDPEGIAYHWERGTLFIVSRAQDVIVETEIDGTLLNTWDIGPYGVNFPAGLAIGPGSVNPSVMNVYLSQRGVDNSSTTQDENDGKIFEINITPELNLSITKSDGLTNIRPGKSLTYTIVVSNNGPYANSVSNIPVQDTLPAGLINATWTCSASGGSCTANGVGDIDTLVTLSSGGAATFVVTAGVDLTASGDLVNTATVGVPLGFTDPNLTNNSATDTTTIDVNTGLCGSDSSLVACFPFEEGSGTTIYDSSSKYNDGTVYGSPAWSTGQVGTYALDLNGVDQYGLVPDNGSLDLTDAITIAAWIKPEQFATQELVKKAVSGATNGYELSLAPTSTTVTSQKVFFRINQASNGNTYRLLSLTPYPADGSTWMHVAATFDGSTMKLYINGVLNNSMSAPVTITQNDRELMIGAQYASGAADRFFMGEMDDVRLYNKVLSAGEIASLAGSNSAPVANDDNYSTDFNTVLNVVAPGVLNNDTDSDGDPLTAAKVSDPAHGTVTVNSDGSFTYTPTTDYSGPDSFTYKANDGLVDSNTATVNITVNPDNNPPVATDDSYSTDEDVELVVTAPGVLSNDTDTETDPLTAVKVTDPTNGSLTLNADGSFSYTPNADYNGPDSFTYKANDGTSDSNVATVTITVNAINDAPVASGNNYITLTDTPLIIAAPGVLGNDSDVDGDPLTSVLDTDVSHGTLTLNANGSFTYTPTTSYNGPDSFTYHANDGLLDSNIVTVNISVNVSNSAPTAADDSYSTDEDVELVVAAPGVLTNDTDPDTDPLTAAKVTDPANGTLTLNADGSFTYTPNADYNGSDSFTYHANDGLVDSNTATVTITINAVNDAPVAADDSYSTDEDTPLTEALPGILTNDSDTEGDPLTAVLDTNVSNGTLTLNPDGSFTYTPTAEFNGSDSFTYHANDGTADSNIATVTITVNAVDDVPVAVDDSYSTDEDTALVVVAPGVAGNDTEQDGDPLTVSKVTDPTHGSLTLNADGSFSYTPNADYNGPDSFTYKLNDGFTDSNIATVSITVNAVNDAPVAAGDSYSTDEDVELVVTAPGVLGNDTDLEGDLLTAVKVTDPANGSLTLNTNGSFSYTPNADYNGPDSFTYKANDGAADSNIATVTITVNAVDDVPVAVDDSYSTDEDVELVVAAPGVAGNDTEQDGDPLTVSKVTDPTHGSLTLNADGSFSYTPNADYNGPDSFTYKLNDGFTDSNIATVSITVNAVNDAPVATGDSYSTDEDVELVVTAPGVLGNDTDLEGDLLTAVKVTDPANGSLTLNADGSFSYTPNADYNGPDSFTYKANDGAADSNVVTVTITVNPIADAPVAVDDSYSTDEDVEMVVAAPGVLGNDTDAENDPLTAIKVTNPTHGTLTLNADGSFTYTPVADYNGPDSFTYKTNDGTFDSNVATVNITVNAVNDAPVATDDSYSTDEDVELVITAPGVLGNDTDTDLDPLTAVKVTDPANGSLTLNADGSFSYTPDADYNGPDSFTYKANDGSADSNIVTVNITVNAVNDAPVATDDSYSTDEDVELIVAAPGVLGNDTDAETDPLTAVKVTNPTHGILTLNADGSFSYTPDADYNGPDSFTYKANDGALDGNVVTVSITVNAVNDAPVATNDFYYTDEDTKLIVNPGGSVMLNDTDVEGDSITAILVTDVSHGTLSFKSNGTFSYDPDPAYSGPDSFTYKVNDGSLDSNTATVTIAVGAINDAPVANDDSYSTDEDVALVVAAPGVIDNDTDIEGDPLTAVKVTNPTHGSLTLNSDGSFTYTPTADYNGPDSFTYKVNDGIAESNIATVNITVNAINDAPVATDDSYSTDEDVELVVSAPGVLGNDTDLDGDLLTAVKVTDPAHGSLTLNADGSFTYTPDADYNGPDSFTYKANDGTLDSNVVTVNITVNAVNDAPVATDDSYSTDEDVELVVAAPGVLGNDTDLEGDLLTAVKVTDPTHGSLTLNADGSFTYTPDADYNGPDSFTYKANDGTLDSNVVTVNITVNAVNDAPIATDDSYSTDEDVALVVAAPGVLGNDTDLEGDLLTAIKVTNPTNGTLTLNADGSFTYTPAADYNGPDSFTYKANDGTLDSNVVTVNITVNAVNDAPVATDDAYSTIQNNPLVVVAPGVLANDSDPEDDSLDAIKVTDPANGSLTLNADGSFTYAPDTDYIGPDSFTYKANDGALDSNIVTVNITVNPSNTAPSAVDNTYSTSQNVQLTRSAPGVLGNDTDPEADPLTAILVSDVSHGTLTLNADGSFTYVPDTDYLGPDSFTYKANDGTLDSNVATVNITVNPPVMLTTNNSFELELPADWMVSRGIEVVDGRDCTEKQSGDCSWMLNGNGSEKRIIYHYRPDGSAGDSFDFSIWRKGIDTAGPGYMAALIRIIHKDGSFQETMINFNTGTVSDWEEITGTIVATEDYQLVTVSVVYKKPGGTLWVDDISLVKNSTVEMTTNQSFELSMPEGWSFARGTEVVDGRDCAVQHSEACSWEMSGNGIEKRIVFHHRPDGFAGDTFNFSIWRKGINTAGPGYMVALVRIIHKDGSFQETMINFNTGTVSDWEEITGTIVATEDYQLVTVSVVYKKPGGTLWVDDISLEK